ncbi:hypothetical protein Ancab_014483, partial [Ancistrocladus abbreviatus]
ARVAINGQQPREAAKAVHTRGTRSEEEYITAAGMVQCPRGHKEPGTSTGGLGHRCFGSERAYRALDPLGGGEHTTDDQMST